MPGQRNPVQSFVRNVIRWGFFIPFWLFLVKSNFTVIWEGVSGGEAIPNLFQGSILIGIGKTFFLLWIANVLAKMIHILPEWERLVLLRLGRSVGARGTDPV